MILGGCICVVQLQAWFSLESQLQITGECSLRIYRSAQHSWCRSALVSKAGKNTGASACVQPDCYECHTIFFLLQTAVKCRVWCVVLCVRQGVGVRGGGADLQ